MSLQVLLHFEVREGDSPRARKCFLRSYEKQILSEMLPGASGGGGSEAPSDAIGTSGAAGPTGQGAC